MVRLSDPPSTVDRSGFVKMPRRPIRYESMAVQARKTRWLRVFIWVFIFVFAFSIVGGLFVVGGLAGR